MIIQVKPCPFLAAACDWLKSGFLLRARVSLSQSDGYYDIDYNFYYMRNKRPSIKTNKIVVFNQKNVSAQHSFHLRQAV